MLSGSQPKAQLSQNQICTMSYDSADKCQIWPKSSLESVSSGIMFFATRFAEQIGYDAASTSVSSLHL